MEKYELGYDIDGRSIVINENGEYVTHIPCNLSKKEVLDRCKEGTMKVFDARNQGLQNFPSAQTDISTPVRVAPREDWAIHDAWNKLWLADYDYDDPRDFDEFYEEYKERVGKNKEAADDVIYRYVKKPKNWK